MNRCTMVPGFKTGRRKTATSGNVLSGSEACPAVIGTPLTLSDETQPPDDTQTVVEETQPGGVGVRMMLHIRRQMKMEMKVVEGGKSAEEDDEDDVAKSVEGSINGNHTVERLSDDVDGGQSKALSTVENSAFKDKQQRDGPLQRATARTMRKDDLKMKGTEQRKGRRRKGQSLERQQQPYPYLADDALGELKVAYEALKEHNISSEAANIEVIILYEFIKQHVCDIEAKKGELLGLYEAVRQHSNILGAENSELVKKLGDYQPRISVLERQLDEMHSSSDEMASSISNQVEVLHKEVAERASILKQEWNSTVVQVVQTVEKLDALIRSLFSSTPSIGNHDCLDIGSRVAASVDAATKVIDNLQEKLEASGKDHTAMCSSYKDMIEKFNDLHRKNELAIGVLHGVHGNLERLVNDSCEHVEQSQIINQNENLIDPLHLDNYDTLMEKLAVLLGERLQFKSMNDKLNLELIDMAKEMEKLKKTCLDSDTILKLVEDVEGAVKLNGTGIDSDKLESRLQRLISFLSDSLEILTRDYDEVSEKAVQFELQNDKLQKEVSALQEKLVEKEHPSDSLEILTRDFDKVSEKVVQFELENDKLQEEVSALQEKLVEKVRNQEHIEGEIRRLEDLVHDLLKDSVTEDVVSAGSSTECLEQLLKKLSEKYTTLALEKPILVDSADEKNTKITRPRPMTAKAGRKRSTRVRGRTLGKGVQKRIARKKGEKLHVYVNRVLNAITGGNATPATNELGLQIRRLCPLQSVKSWTKINESTKDAVIQAVLDKFIIGDDFDNDEQAQQILDKKAYLLYKDWRYNLKQEFLELEEKGVDDPYSHPPSGVSLDDWRYLIDVAWKNESHLKRSKAGKANRAMLPYNHTSGSRSFPIAMSLMANEDGEIDFPEFYKKSHKSKKTGDWIDPKCVDDMVNLQVVATDAGLPLTHEELSRQVLGAKKNYLRGCGIGPQPSLTASNVAQARDKHMESMRTELEALREERERDHEELLKEKEERQRDHEELLKEKEERQRDREEIMREREELTKQIEEEKKAREAQQVQLNHLNDVVSRLTTLLQGSDGHSTIRL
ncbi:unnamed protein product [Camellia sinensis]